MNHMDFSQYMPHGMCLLWEPWLVGLWVLSDTLISLSYFAIPFAILRVLRARPDIRFRGLMALFASFIMLCGLTHVLSIVTLWFPIYPPMGWVKLATGLVSMTTAIVLFRLVPVLRTIPSPAQLQAANDELRAAIGQRDATLDDLRRLQAELEARVEARTAELAEANDRTEIAMREAVHRSVNLLAVVNALARQSARGVTELAAFITAFTGRIDALARATTAVMRDGSETGAWVETVARDQLEPLLMTFGSRLAISGPPVRTGTSAAQHLALAFHELGTNAQKYGALSSETGQVQLSWEVERTEGGEDMFRVTWRETTSAPPPRGSLGAGTGFGARLLTSVVPAALGGAADHRIEPEGVVWTLRAPLAALVPTEARRTQPRPGDAAPLTA
ncbi:sensor histidine kinase [Jannaschia formosa]|uniref:sensor histidine kinase n=1 Tax=Jannaschia formosa TaxID=2259592 RepID=UPI000E1B7857|nr:sensor histidine kinase [Jannaschia formosa]TFL19080.1 sensor histidine kinase [Jannaschia formosa]